MSKKLITTCMALVAVVAFALPAGASGSPRLTYPTGTSAATGTRWRLTVIEILRFRSTPGETLTECSSGSMAGEVTKNNGTEIEGNLESTAFSGTAAEGKCTGLGGVKVTTNVGNGTPWCLRATNAMNTDEFQIRGGKCSEAARSITFVQDTGLGVNCSYERSTSLKGTFTTDSTGSAILSLNGSGATGVEDTGFTREGTNVLCPASLTVTVLIILEHFSTSSPMFIS